MSNDLAKARPELVERQNAENREEDEKERSAERRGVFARGSHFRLPVLCVSRDLGNEISERLCVPRGNKFYKANGEWRKGCTE